MTKIAQLQKNIKLSGKLANYLASNPSVIQNSSKSTSFVPFSATDKLLNVANKKIVKGLQSEGKKVIEANETKDKNNPWVFNFI